VLDRPFLMVGECDRNFSRKRGQKNANGLRFAGQTRTQTASCGSASLPRGSGTPLNDFARDGNVSSDGTWPGLPIVSEQTNREASRIWAGDAHAHLSPNIARACRKFS
jgi:hypothetical protein